MLSLGEGGGPGPRMTCHDVGDTVCMNLRTYDRVLDGLGVGRGQVLGLDTYRDFVYPPCLQLIEKRTIHDIVISSTKKPVREDF